MASGITWEDRTLLTRLQTFNARAHTAISAAVRYHATRAVAHARTNAPWTDRTSNARNGLFAEAQISRPTYRIVVGHGVPYGIWLETRFSGRNAIIRPTVDREGPLLMATVSGLFGKMFG